MTHNERTRAPTQVLKRSCRKPTISASTVAPDTTQHSSEGSAEGLVLRLIGLARTRAMRKTSIIVPGSDGARSTTHREVVTERKDFLSYEVHLASFDGRAANGTYSYPFSVLLPPGLPSSMQVRWNFLEIVAIYLRVLLPSRDRAVSWPFF